MWIEENCKILDKRRRLRPFIFNTGQQIIYRFYRRALEEDRPFRALVPKARQLGVSTEASGLAYEQFCNKPGTNVAVVAHKDTASRNLFRIPKRFHANHVGAPDLESDSRLELVTKASAGRPESRYMVMTAASGDDLGKSYTIQWFHGSECANWTVDPDDAFASLANAVPDDPGTAILLESTCRGRDPFFYPFMQDALEGRNDYQVIFIPWYVHGHEYSMSWADYRKIRLARDVDPGEVFEPTEEELSIRQKVLDQAVDSTHGYLIHEITDEQFIWRRYTLANKVKRGMDDFNRYYPTFLEDCWTFTENRFFSPQTVVFYQEAAKEPEMRGTLRWDEAASEPVLQESRVGGLKIWQRALPDCEYVIGADPSEGLPGRDLSAAYVLRRGARLTVDAAFRLRIDPEEFAKFLYWLGMHYNWAHLAVENNRCPEVAKYLAAKHSYPKLWWHRNLNAVQKQVTRPGFNMTIPNRKIVLDLLYAKTKNSHLVCYDERIPIEMQDFVLNEKTQKFEAAPGRHDDCLMALGIGLAVVDFLTGGRDHKEPEPVVEDRKELKYRQMQEMLEFTRRSRRNRERRYRRRGGMKLG